MTTTHEPSRACYLRGCPDAGCHAANKRYLKQYRLERARTGNRRTSSTSVVEHVKRLMAQGWSCDQIAHVANCSPRIIFSLADAQYPTIERRLAARVLAAQPTLDTVPPRSLVNATGSIRRIRALIAAGYSLQSLADGVGMRADRLGNAINHDHERMTAQNAAAICALYDRLKGQPGPNLRARLRGQRAGWQTPDYWEDYDRIDDPTFDPSAPARTLRIDDIAEDALWLSSTGLTSRKLIAERLGVSLDYVHRALAHAAEQVAA